MPLLVCTVVLLFVFGMLSTIPEFKMMLMVEPESSSTQLGWMKNSDWFDATWNVCIFYLSRNSKQIFPGIWQLYQVTYSLVLLYVNAIISYYWSVPFTWMNFKLVPGCLPPSSQGLVCVTGGIKWLSILNDSLSFFGYLYTLARNFSKIGPQDPVYFSVGVFK